MGETSANLYVQTTLPNSIPANGFIRVTLPPTNEVKVKSGTLQCSIIGDVTQTNLNCNASPNGLVITA